MPSLKEYKNKLRSLKNIAKITKTMKLVAASKLRQAQHAQSRAKLYAWELTELIARLAASVQADTHPLLRTREAVKNVMVLVVTSDKGLCAGFNNNLGKKVVAWMREKKMVYDKVDLSFCGKRGFMYFKMRGSRRKLYENTTAKPDFLKAKEIGEELSRWFVAGEYDEVYLAYNQFNNPLSQTPMLEKILPIESMSLTRSAAPLSTDYIFEPAQVELLQFLIPRFLYFKIYYALLENSAGEHGARMSAMDKATQNASDLIDRYTLLRNRARQAAITKELIEIVSGAEALK